MANHEKAGFTAADLRMLWLDGINSDDSLSLDVAAIKQRGRAKLALEKRESKGLRRT